MKRYCLILIQLISAIILVSSVTYAAPTIDGVFRYTESNDWGSLSRTNFNATGFNDQTALHNVSVEEGKAGGNTSYNNNYFDVEEIGVYVNDNTLYIGLQTEYNFTQSPSTSNTYAGDFMFDLEKSSDNANFSDNHGQNNEFAFRFSLSSNNTVDMTLFAGNLTYKSTTGYNNFGTAWKVNSSDLQMEFNNVGKYSTSNNGCENGYYNGQYTLEAAIDLNRLSGQLNTLFSGWAQDYQYVTMFWQPSCGNDFLAARSKFDYNPAPEPATLLLFGMGLLGAGALGRKRISQAHSKKSEI